MRKKKVEKTRNIKKRIHKVLLLSLVLGVYAGTALFSLPAYAKGDPALIKVKAGGGGYSGDDDDDDHGSSKGEPGNDRDVDRDGDHDGGDTETNFDRGSPPNDGPGDGFGGGPRGD